MVEEALQNAQPLLKEKPEIKVDMEYRWVEKGLTANFRAMCQLLKVNAIPTAKLNMNGDYLQ